MIIGGILVPRDGKMIRLHDDCVFLIRQMAEQLKMSPNVNTNITINITSNIKSEIDPKEFAEKISKMIADTVKRGVTSV